MSKRKEDLEEVSDEMEELISGKKKDKIGKDDLSLFNELQKKELSEISKSVEQIENNSAKLDTMSEISNKAENVIDNDPSLAQDVNLAQDVKNDNKFRSSNKHTLKNNL